MTVEKTPSEDGNEQQGKINPNRIIFEDRGGFASTGEHRRFVEFCEDRRRYCDVGVCVGTPGIGKTFSARKYAMWEALEPFLDRHAYVEKPPPEVASCHAVYYTVQPAHTPKSITLEIERKRGLLSWMVDTARSYGGDPGNGGPAASADNAGGLVGVEDRTELLIVDEAQFLKNNALEQLRNLYDRDCFGLVLIGMPGLDRTLTRYQQLYSRIGFLYRYKSLDAARVRDILKQPSVFGVDLGAEAFSEEAIAGMIRHSEGNFRTLEKLTQRVESILEINKRTVADAEVVQLARQQILLGPS